MITDEMTEEQMMEAMKNADEFERKIRAAMKRDILIELREFGMESAAEMIEENF